MNLVPKEGRFRGSTKLTECDIRRENHYGAAIAWETAAFPKGPDGVSASRLQAFGKQGSDFGFAQLRQ